MENNKGDFVMEKQENNHLFFKVMNYLSDTAILSILWLIGSLPILTIGASTTALFYVSGKNVGGKDYRIVADFFKSYKQNFFQSIEITILLGVMWFSSVAYFMMGYAPLNEGLNLSILVIIFVAFEVTMLSIYMCALLAKYELKTITLIKNSFLFTHAYFKESIQAFGVVVMMLFCLLIVPGLIILLPGTIALTASYFVRNSIMKFLKRQEILKELREEQTLDF